MLHFSDSNPRNCSRTYISPAWFVCALKQTDKKSHCSAHSQSCCFTPLLARINKNVGWKRDFLVVVEKPWPKCGTLEAFNNLYRQQESKMENFVLIPPTLNLVVFWCTDVFFYTVFSQDAVLWLWVSHFILTYYTADETEQSRKWQMSKWQNSRSSHRKKKQTKKTLQMCRLSGWLICLFRWFIATNCWNNLCVWCLQNFWNGLDLKILWCVLSFQYNQHKLNIPPQYFCK